MIKVKCIFYDAGGTLVAPYPSVDEVYAQIAQKHGYEVLASDLTGAFAKAWAQCQEEQSGASRPIYGTTDEEAKAWWFRVVRETFGPHATRADFAQLFEEIYAEFAKAERFRLYDDVMETLAAFRDHKQRQGLISNWDTRLPRILNGLGLDRLLDPVVISSQVGFEKPDPRIFWWALWEADCRPGEALYVGDHYRQDVQGARGLGIHTVLINRAGEEKNLPPDVTIIHSLTKLLDLVEC